MFTYLKLAIAAGLLVIGFISGNTYQSGVAARLELSKQESQAKTLARQADRINTAALTNEIAKEAIKTKYVTITKEINHVIDQNPIYRDICFDDAGLLQLNTAIGESTSTSESITSLPSVKQVE